MCSATPPAAIKHMAARGLRVSELIIKLGHRAPMARPAKSLIVPNIARTPMAHLLNRLDVGAAMQRNHARPLSRRRGMTLLELVVVATIAGLMLGMVLPKISSFREQMLLDSTAQGLARDIIRTRGEALKRNEPVTVRRLDDTAYQVRAEQPRRLPTGLTFVGPSVDSTRFHPFGLVAIGVGEWRIQAVSTQRRVVVRTTGHVRVE